jgi:tetratricopeptide (TPR) repeat protein
MWNRTALLGGLAVALALTVGVVWWQTGGASSVESEAETEESLPVPPIPPRIADSPDYERCLAMLNTNPSGARAFADAWQATGGGDGATHCLALAIIALGEPDTGAELMDKLAASSKAPSVARASIYGQAGQAWLIAGEPDRALASTTLALSMTPDDADLLIDRSIAAATLEHYQDAVDDLTHALDLDPRRPDALVFRAAAWRHVNQLDLAQDDIDRAFALDPENADALLERGILRQRRGDRDGARQDWERAVQLSPDTATGDLAQQNLALLDAGPDRR